MLWMEMDEVDVDAELEEAALPRRVRLGGGGGVGGCWASWCAWGNSLQRFKAFEEFLVLHDASVDAPDKHGDSPLHCAARAGDAALVMWLLDRGADPNIKNQRGFSPLHEACLANCLGAAERLLDRGADPNQLTPCMDTPMILAVTRGHDALVRLLWSRGAALDWAGGYDYSALHAAVMENHASTAILLLKLGADPGSQAQGAGGATPLILAAQKGQVDVVRALLECGEACQPDAAEWLQGWTALHFSVAEEHMTCLQALLDAATVDINCPARDGRTPLMLAVSYGRGPALDLLLQQKVCDVNATDAQSRMTALHRAADLGHTHETYALLTHGADPDAIDLDLATPLLLAVNSRHLGVVQLLVGENCNMNVPGEPLKLCVERGYVDIAELLVEAGADLKQCRTWAVSGTWPSKVTRSPARWRWLTDTVTSPRTLSHITRLAIRRNLGRGLELKVEQLPLPRMLRHFILLK